MRIEPETHEAAHPDRPQSSPFYVTGGTLRGDAACYVRREADEALFASLVAGEFCYVLDARQMGKSSLMIRTAERLEADGITVIKLDLTAVGLDLSSEQWYFGLLEGLGCGLESELEAYWEAHRQMGPLRRWFKAIEEVLLPKSPGRVVIFVDEIDIVRSLPFPTDEFFAGIRECHNRRASDPEIARLAFCLLGVATPSDLIEDVGMTPFNVGTRVELSDFTPQEAALLAQGLCHGGRDGQNLLERVLHWTGGHPYLTQQLCLAVAESDATRSDADVDRLCADLFLCSRARQRDNNLIFVRGSLLRSGPDVASLLELYAKAFSRRRLADDETNPLVEQLRLSGIVRAISGSLRVRNRIYRTVFGPDWVRANMPYAEVRRQMEAYRRGIVRASAVFVAIATVMGILAWLAVRNGRVAQAKATEARASADILRQNLYAADMYLAQHAVEENDLARARSLLEPYRPKHGEKDLRGFEWRYLWRLTRDQNRATIQFARKTAGWSTCRFSPDGRVLALATSSLELYDPTTMHALPPMPFAGVVFSAVFSPDGKTLAVREGLDRVVLCDLATRSRKASFPAPRPLLSVVDVAFSPDGKTLAIAGAYSPVQLWDISTRKPLLAFDGVRFVSFSPDGRLLAANDNAGGVVLWNRAAGRKRHFRSRRYGSPVCIAFSPDSKRLIVGEEDGKTWTLDITMGKMTEAPMGHGQWVSGVACSPNGRFMASGSVDGTVRLWEPASGLQPRLLLGHQGGITAVAFSPDSKTLVSTSSDSTARFWETDRKPQIDSVEGNFAALSPDGRVVATRNLPGSDVDLLDVKTLRKKGYVSWDRRFSKGEPAAFSADGRLLYLQIDNDAQSDRRILGWDIAAKRAIADMPAKDVSWSLYWPSPDRTLLATYGMSTRNVRIFDMAARQERAPMDGRFAVFSSDGRWLGISGKDQGYHIYETHTWKLVAPVLTTEATGFGPGAFSIDGRLLATATGRGEIVIWNTSSWTKRAVFQAHISTIRTINFSPDGKTLVTSGDEPVVKLWNTATWRLTQTLNSGTTFRVQISPDGDTLMTCGRGSGIRFWRAPSLAEIDAGSR